jgi:hypothetical protein
MRRFIETAIANYQATSPAHRAKVNAACVGLLAFALYLGYEALVQGWRKALGIFLAVSLFCLVAAMAGWLGMKLSAVFGESVGTAIGAAIVLGFIGLVLYFIFGQWGR